jgi:hypothetical protein
MTANLMRRALALALFLPATVFAQGTKTAQPDNADVHRDAYLRERSYPFDSIAPGAMQRALESVRGMRGTPVAGTLLPNMSRNGLVAAGSGAWRSIGPTPISPTSTYYNGRGPTSGRVNAIAVHPRNGSVIYIATARGGVWKTVNGGVTWMPLTDTQCALVVNSIVLDPVNPEIVYAATGDHGGNFSNSCGVLRSTDGGANWTQLGAATFMLSNFNYSLLDLFVDPASAGSTNSTTLLVSTNCGIYRSTNSGVSWTYIANICAESFALGASDGSVIYAGSLASTGVNRSTDHGLTWTKVYDATSRIKVASAPSAPGTVYAAACAGSRLDRVLRTTDRGTTWVTVDSTLKSDFTRQCGYDLHIGVDGGDSKLVYVGGVSLYRSTNGGATFTHSGDQQVHADQHAIATDPRAPGVVYAGSDGGIFRSLDGGVTWTSLNATISTALFTRGIAINPLNPAQVIGGTQDNGTLETNGTSVWSEVSSGDGGYSAYDVNTGATAYTEYVWGDPGNAGPQRRIGNGGFAYENTGINMTDRGAFYPPLVVDPVRGRMLYFGTHRVYRTANSATLWTPISGDLSQGSGVLTAIAAAASDSNVVYAGSSDGRISATADLGLTWTTGTGLVNRYVTAITVDSTNARTAYATVSGFAGPHVWKTVDGGATWNSISKGLPDAPANDVIYQPATGELDVATDVGLFRTMDGGATWTLFDGLPNVVIMALAWNGASHTLVAATYGRGMFAYQYAATTALRGDVDGDRQITAADALAVLSAVIGKPIPAGQRLWPNGDANCDGTTSVLDAQVILSFVVGLPLGSGCVNVSR